MPKKPQETIGHNSVDADKLKQYVNAILEVRKGKEALALDEQGIFARACDEGFNRKAIREALAELKRPQEDDYKAVTNAYFKALGLEPKYA